MGSVDGVEPQYNTQYRTHTLHMTLNPLVLKTNFDVGTGRDFDRPIELHFPTPLHEDG